MVKTRPFKTKSGQIRNQAYLYNPLKDSYGWYNIDEQYITKKGRELTQAKQEARAFVNEADIGDKEARLRANIQKVLDSRLDAGRSEIPGIRNLYEAMVERLDNMSDLEIMIFAEENARYIEHFFEYEIEYSHGAYADIDARTYRVAQGLGINPSDYLISEEVPQTVQNALNRLDDKISLSGEDFE